MTETPARSAASRPVPTLDGLAGIAERYDLILCDVWGVLHDGTNAHPGASDALMRFRALPEAGRPRRVVLVSNAPRPWAGVQAILDGFGVPRAAYDAILTSGDLTRSLIAAHPGERLHHLGPERDATIFDGLDVKLVDVAAADRVVCTGLFDDTCETAEDYRATLEAMRARAVPMICANPDLVVERGGQIVPCAGSVALAYEEIGGKVVYAGKPHRPIYEVALALAQQKRGAPIARERICGIGDAIRTDIAGADAFGATGIMVLAGIHAQDLMEASWDQRHGWFSRQSHRPAYAMPHLVW